MHDLIKVYRMADRKARGLCRKDPCSSDCPEGWPIFLGSREKVGGEGTHVVVFNLGIHGCLVVVQGGVGDEA